jgi:hypothetical protein
MRDGGAVGVGRAGQLHLGQPALAAHLLNRSPERFLRFVAAAHATTLAGASPLCF